jgi:hypothetical protein
MLFSLFFAREWRVIIILLCDFLLFCCCVEFYHEKHVMNIDEDISEAFVPFSHSLFYTSPVTLWRNRIYDLFNFFHFHFEFFFSQFYFVRFLFV